MSSATIRIREFDWFSEQNGVILADYFKLIDMT
ncbi:Uncharacterised protein [Vibrio cholerae]|nr:Uncharacterised protein [Vibrio cholerae]CSI74861.1 Uncharacterised protein [Vibrio cholerae]